MAGVKMIKNEIISPSSDINIHFDPSIKNDLSFIFRYRVVTSYKKILAIATGFVIVLEVGDYIANIDLLSLPVVYHRVLIFLVAIIGVFSIKRCFYKAACIIMQEPTGIDYLGVSLSNLFDQEKKYRYYKKEMVKALFLKNKVDKIAILFGFIIGLAYPTEFMIRRFEMTHNISYGLYGYWDRPIILPWYGLLMHYAQFLFIAISIYLITNVVFRILYLAVIIYKLSREKDIFVLKSSSSVLAKLLATNFNVEIDSLEEMQLNLEEFTSFYTIIQNLSKIFSIASFFAISIGVLVEIFFILAVGLEIMVTLTVPQIALYVLYGTAIVIFVLPVFNFKHILSEYKSILSGVLQNIYEIKVYNFLRLPPESEKKNILANDISTLQDMIVYVQDLNTWPFDIPQFIRISLISLVSSILPYILDFLI